MLLGHRRGRFRHTEARRSVHTCMVRWSILYSPAFRSGLNFRRGVFRDRLPWARTSTVHATNFRKQFTEVGDACVLAQAIVDTVREPILVLDKDLRVLAASPRFIPHSTPRLVTPRGDFSTRWEMGSGTFQNCAYSWRKSFRNTAQWRTTRSSTNYPRSASARCA